VAAYADNAVFQSSLTAFRIEGKEAIRGYFAELFKLYPARRVLLRQPASRAYNDDLVVQNGYAVLYLTDTRGQTAAYHTRSSVTWAKVGGRWQIVDQHTSRLPVAP
jgi:ketosteroid isomerase-like protein